MKIVLMSDLHTEFDGKNNFIIPPVENEKEIILCLAGDIGLAEKPYTTYLSFIEDVSKRFAHVIWIAGNHEHYGGKFKTTYAKIWNEVLDFDNVYFIEKETIIIDDVAFIGATMWSSFDNNNPITMNIAQSEMNDYGRIRNGPDHSPWQQKLKPIDTLADHMRAKEFIFPEILKQKADGKKVVVITHHAPSILSIHENFRTDKIIGAYYSELFENIMDSEPDLWCHGYVHDSCDYMIGKTRVLVNPRGYYPNGLNPNFDPGLIVTI